MIIIRGVKFNSAFDGAGVRNFDGRGYWQHGIFHRLFPRGFDFGGQVFVAKSTPFLPNVGFMPLREDGLTPKEKIPRCIIVNFRKAFVLNAVKLSSPGLYRLLESGIWQNRTDNFFISLAFLSQTRIERLEELRLSINLLLRYQSGFKGNVGLQIDYSCPSVKVVEPVTVDEVHEGLEMTAHLRVPTTLKFNLFLSKADACKIAEHEECDLFHVTNAMPWGSIPDKIDWRGLFGADESPLKEFGGGGLSGAPLLDPLIDWLERVGGDISKPICAGGGIVGRQSVCKLLNRIDSHTVMAIALSSVAIVRPWRLQETIGLINDRLQ